jgi:hypothetical protein
MRVRHSGPIVALTVADPQDQQTSRDAAAPHRSRRRSHCASAWLAVAAAAIAPASASAAPTVYGGDAGPDHAPFALELNPGDGIDVGRVAFDLTVSCPGFDRFLDITDALPLVSPLIRPQVNALYSGPVTAEGDWDATGIVFYRIGRYDLEIDETIKGKVTGTDATGTFRAKAKLYSRRAGKPDIRCRPARHRWRARSVPGRIFAGATADDRPVVIEVADDATSVRRARVSGWATCGGARGSTTQSTWRNFALDGDGHFDISTPYSYRSGGTRFRGREAIKGDIAGAVARGRFSDRWTARYADGDKETCATGSVRYKARTSPAEPTPPA